MNRLILGDNLEILKTLDDELIDLVYLDPPFFSNRNYEVIWGDAGEIRSFEDRWAGGIDHYIAWLKERVEQMYRVLKKTGSLFLHCDWHADAYIRIEILDRLFGTKNMVNHIIWRRTNTPKGSQFTNRQFGIATDSIFFYAKSKRYFFDDKAVRTQISEEAVIRKYPHEDEKGLYYEYPILRSASKGERPNLVYEYKGFTPPSYGWVVNKTKLKEIDKRGDLGWRSNGQPFRKFRPSEDPGQIINNYWDDILRIQSNSKEAIGYPTQKPESLLERIIKCASKEGDLILDPFMGGGTTMAVADKLHRRWLGIDQSVTAVKVTELRLDKQQDMFSEPYSTQLHKYDYDTLRYSDAFEFESWIVGQFGGVSNAKQRGDLGLDGKMPDSTPIQVKRQDGVGRNVIDNFKSAVERADKKLFTKNVKNKKPVGYIIAFSFSKSAIEEVARLKLKESVLIELVPVDKIVSLSAKPRTSVKMREISRDAQGRTEIEFTAQGTSESEINFYTWDFEYDEKKGFKSSQWIDKEGRINHTFSPGEHTIAVKVVDNEGLESIEIVRLKVNGKIKKM